MRTAPGHTNISNIIWKHKHNKEKHNRLLSFPLFGKLQSMHLKEIYPRIFLTLNKVQLIPSSLKVVAALTVLTLHIPPTGPHYASY